MEELPLFEPGSTIAEQLDALPQFFQTSTAQRGGPALFGNGGGSYLNMRGLGPERTLVLFDGFRMPPADKRGSVNVDTFPTALVRSVDVVTGGASAAYGADALGGVTNFILDREFQGLKLSAGTGMNEFNSDGKNWNISVAGGTEIGERLHIIGSFEARHVDQVNRDPARARPELVPALGPHRPRAPGVFPQRVTVPWVASAGVHVNGRIALAPAGSPVSALTNMIFTDDGSAIVPFDRGTHRGLRLHVTRADAGARRARGSRAARTRDIANRTQPGGPSRRRSRAADSASSASSTTSATRSTSSPTCSSATSSRTRRQSVSAATMSGQWAYSVFRENAYLAGERAADHGHREPAASFLIHKGGSYPRRARRLQHERIAQRVRFGVAALRRRLDDERPMGHARCRCRRGETEKMTGVFDGLRVDRLALAVDAVEIYTDRRDLTGDTGAGPPDGRPDLVAPADRGTGTIVCNVQRYNPTAAQLASASAIQGRTKTTVNGVVPVASPIGLDNTIAECVPFNIMGHGRITPAAADYILTPKWGNSVVEQDFAELLFRGEVSDGWGAGPLSLATGLTYRDQSFNDGAYPGRDRRARAAGQADGRRASRRTSAFAALPPPGRAAARICTSSRRCPRSQAATTSGRRSASSTCRSGSRRRASATSARASRIAPRTIRASAGFDTWKVGLDFQIYRDLRLRATRSRDVREATFSERFDNSPTGGSVNDPAFNDTAVDDHGDERRQSEPDSRSRGHDGRRFRL